jgi:hypothetical protein
MELSSIAGSTPAVQLRMKNMTDWVAIGEEKLD